MFEGRTTSAKKQFIQSIFSNIQQQCGISPQDIEITIFETPKSNWGIVVKMQMNYDLTIKSMSKQINTMISIFFV